MSNLVMSPRQFMDELLEEVNRASINVPAKKFKKVANHILRDGVYEIRVAFMNLHKAVILDTPPSVPQYETVQDISSTVISLYYISETVGDCRICYNNIFGHRPKQSAASDYVYHLRCYEQDRYAKYETLLKGLIKAGFTQPKVKTTLMKDGVKIVVDLSRCSEYNKFGVYIKNEHKKWKKIIRTISDVTDLPFILSLKPEKELKEQPQTMKFCGPIYRKSQYGPKDATYFNHYVNSVLVTGVAKIYDNLKVSTDIAEPDGKKLWFLCNCALEPSITGSGATIRILTDGEEYYHIAGQTQLKIMSHSPQFSNNCKDWNFTELDKGIINHAIQEFTKNA